MSLYDSVRSNGSLLDYFGGTSSIGQPAGPTSSLPPTGGRSSIGLPPGPTSSLPLAGGRGRSSIGLPPGPTSSLPPTDLASAFGHWSG